MEISKVIYGNTTLIDITDTTATASDVATGKYFYLSNGERVQGTSAGGGGMIVVETTDQYGGTIVEITGDPVTLQPKTAVPSTSSQLVAPDSGYTGLSQVTIEAIPSGYVIPAGTTNITENGAFNVAGYASASVSVETSSDFVVNLSYNNQTEVWEPDKTIEEIEAAYYAGKQIATNAMRSNNSTESYGYYGYPSFYYSVIEQKTDGVLPDGVKKTFFTYGEEVSAGDEYDYFEIDVSEADATPSDVKAGKWFVTSTGWEEGTATARTSADLIASGSTITAPAGLYSVAASKSVSAGTAATPATTISITPSISVNTSTGVITATASGSQFVTPTISAGYVSAGTSGKITVSGSNTSNLTTQAAATITPTKSSQTAVAANRYTTGAVTVEAIPAAYQDVTSVTATASDVLSGKTIVNSSGTQVNGSLVIQHYYTGSGTPAAASGSNGDIYLKTS